MSATDEIWRPLGYEGNTEYDGPHDGVPSWMEPSYWEWITASFTRTVTHGVTPHGSRARLATPKRLFDVMLLRRAERILRFTTWYEGEAIREGVNGIRVAVGREERLHLALSDFLLAEGNGDGRQLDTVLYESGSIWKVGTRLGKPGLVRRVPEGAQAHADNVMAGSGDAGKILADAWGNAYGLNPDPSNAYRLAVKAVEEAAIPVVVPNQDDATLGHVIGRLKSDVNWCLPLTREHPDAPTSGVVLQTCQALWKGHHDRHGASGHSIPEVTPEEAETAVTFAVSLVHWFSSGMVARR